MTSQRNEAIDALRGFALINMIAYHLLYDLCYIWGVSIPWFGGNIAHIWQQAICHTFIILSGFTWHYGHHHARRSLLILAAGFAVSAVSYIAMPSQGIFFGILSFFGVAGLLMIMLAKPCAHIPPWIGAMSSLVLFVFTRDISQRVLGFGAWKIFELPQALYAGLWSAPLGFPPQGFASSDYFAILPWMFLYLAAWFLQRALKGRKLPVFKTRIPVLSTLGRHSLLAYVAHQPVIMAVLWLGATALGKKITAMYTT